MATRTPMCLSGPLYEWDATSSDESTTFDELHQRVVRLRPGSFSAVDLVDGGATPPDGITANVNVEGIRQLRFSPDGLHFAFLSDRKGMGCLETLHPLQEPVLLASKWVKTGPDVLNFFWLPSVAQQADHADIVVVSTQGLELFRVVPDQRAAKSVKAFPVAVRMCWVDPISATALVCIGSRTLQPFDMRSKVPQKLPKFDLVLGRDKVIEAHDVVVTTIYDATYCIHADSTNGRVSLRNVSNPAQGTPEHDIVIDMVEEAAWSGTLRVSKLDNLLIVHNLEKMTSTAFDLKHKEGALVMTVCGPSPTTTSTCAQEVNSWEGWEFLNGSTIVDPTNGRIFRLKFDMDVALPDLLLRWPHDLAAVMRFLLRRTNCRAHVVELLKQTLMSKLSCYELAKGFNVVNQAYRQTIEAVSSKAPSNQGRQAIVSLTHLESIIGDQSILSEKDMVSQVFYPHFLSVIGADSPSAAPEAAEEENPLGSPSTTCPSSDSCRIPLPAIQDDGEVVNRTAQNPYMVSVVIAYLRSLLTMQILPHKILQCFVFDVCMYFQQEHTLQQLLHYHVLLDSTDLLLRLKEVCETRGSAWATQACFDMALRLQEHATVADMLLHTRQYLDIVPFLINQQVGSFRIHRLLEQIDSDEAARAEDPDLLDHVAGEILLWHAESSAPASQLMPPNLENCQRWLQPHLAAEAVGVNAALGSTGPDAVPVAA